MKKGLSRIATIAMGLAAMAGMTNVTVAEPTGSTTTQQTNRRDAIAVKPEAPRPMMQVRKAFGFYGTESNKPSRFLNQRQYRKLVRQNPCLAKSKKHRSKN